MKKSDAFYFYKIYGLNVKSQVELEELLSIDRLEDEDIDVTITYDEVPPDVEVEMRKGQYYAFESRRVWFAVPETGIYFIKQGKSISVVPSEGVEKEKIKAYILGSSFGVLLIQRNVVAIHGGSIDLGGKALIITGESGAGKSTLTTAFREAGYLFLADDVSALAKDQDGGVVVLPAYPQQKLCKDAMVKMGYSLNKYKQINAERNKYILPLREQFQELAVPLMMIVELVVSEDEPSVVIEELKGKEKLGALMRNIYRVSAVQELGMSPIYFKACLSVIEQVTIYRMIRPKGLTTTKEQMQCVLSQIKKHK